MSMHPWCWCAVRGASCVVCRGWACACACACASALSVALEQRLWDALTGDELCGLGIQGTKLRGASFTPCEPQSILAVTEEPSPETGCLVGRPTRAS
eukprot:9974794-Alexandrium_andersonii.AAC.1